MKITRIKYFINKEEPYINSRIKEYEEDGYEVSQVLTNSPSTHSGTKHYITIVFTKNV